MQALQSLLTDITTLKADFIQRMGSEDDERFEELEGHVWLKKPLQFRWEVLGADPRVIVSDGTRVWDYDESLEQVTVQGIDPNDIQAPIFFLTGDRQSLEGYEIVSLYPEKSTCLKSSEQCFRLTPKQSEGSFQWIEVGFLNKKLKELRVLDQLGQISDFQFNNIELNQEVPDAQFDFEPPENVDVLESQ